MKQKKMGPSLTSTNNVAKTLKNLQSDRENKANSFVGEYSTLSKNRINDDQPMF